VPKSINKISYLDGIRGVAAFSVVIHHFLLAFYSACYNFDEHATHLHNWDVKFGRSLYNVFANGNYCVCIFFVLSGFVLSRKYFKNNTLEFLISGAQRRFVRLYIPVAAALIIAFIMMEAHAFFNHQVAPITHSDWWLGVQFGFTDIWTQFYKCLLYRTMFFVDGTFITSTWTIAIEFYYSMIVFAFLALTHGTRNRTTSLIIMLLFCCLTDNAFLTAFMLGISLNYTEARKNHLSRKTLLFASAALLLVGLVLGSYPTNNQILHTFYGRTPEFIVLTINSNWFHTVGAYLLVLAFVLSTRLQHFLSLRLFRFLGYISFAIYLLHPLVIGSITSYIFLQAYPRVGYNASVGLAFLVTIAACVPASWLMTRYIDGPGIKLAKKIYTRYFKNTAAPVSD